MKKGFSVQALFCVILLISIFSACRNTAEVDPRYKKITKKWTLKSLKSSEIISNDSNKKDALLLSSDSLFSLTIISEKIAMKGNWKIQDSDLVFTKIPNDTILNTDSTSYIAKNGNSFLEHYSGMKLVGKSTSKGFEPKREVVHYKLAKLNNSELVLVEMPKDGNKNPKTLNFKYVSDIQSSGVSWQGIMNGIIGILGLTCIGFLLSNNKRRINWKLIIKALILQFLFAYLVLKVPQFSLIFGNIAKGFVTVLEFSREGSKFLFGNLVADTKSFGFIFVFQVLPTIIFFAALTSALFYLNILQKVVFVVAYVMKRLMKLSGAESLASAANIFVGQTEAPLVIKPYISRMTKSETMALMTGGMAHISGGVLAAYIGFLGGGNPEEQRLFATHLLSASIMTAPGTFFAAKLMVPETEKFDTELKINKQKIGSNILDAIANGTGEGLRLAVNVAAMLLVFIAFITMLNYMMENWIGNWTGLNDIIAKSSGGKVKSLSLEYILGYVFAPIAWLIGIRGADVSTVGQLLGTKVILNEFVAYIKFSEVKEMFVHKKDVIITTYALCGFANFASIGIQLGGIGTLAPDKRPMLASLGIKALIGGTIANLLSAAIAGMMI